MAAATLTNTPTTEQQRDGLRRQHSNQRTLLQGLVCRAHSLAHRRNHLGHTKCIRE
jgi:hypothetical protein